MGRLAIAAVFAAGCQLPLLDLTGKQCPCPSGWTCDTATHTCVGNANHSDAAPDTTDTSIDASTLDRNLVFWFKLDETTGTMFADASGHGYDGTTKNPPHTAWVPTGGKVGGALQFDGSGFASVPCPPDGALTHAFTVATWVNFDTFATAPFTLSDFAVVEGTGGGMDGEWGLGATDLCGTHTIGLELALDSSSSIRTTRCGATAIALKTWYFITGVYDGATPQRADVYLDGVLDDGTLLGTVPGALFQSGSCPLLAVPSNQVNHLAGLLDEVRVYDRALSSAEVLALYGASGG